MSGIKALPRDSEGRVPNDVLDALFANSQHTEARVSNIEKTLDNLAAKMDALTGIVTRQAAIQPYKIGDTLDIVSKASTLLVIAAGAIIFIATSISAGPIASLQARDLESGQRMMRLEQSVRRTEERQLEFILKNSRIGGS